MFRFNRCSSRSRGWLFYRILQLGVGHPGITYVELIATDPRLWRLATHTLASRIRQALARDPTPLNYLPRSRLWRAMGGLGIAYGPEEVATQLVFVKLVDAPMQGRLFSLMKL